MANIVVGKEITSSVCEYPYDSFLGTIQMLRETTPTSSVWGLCIESPARQGFEDFERPLRQWFTLGRLEEEILKTFHIGEKVRVYSYRDLSVARIEKGEA